jgi:hypothetical protein
MAVSRIGESPRRSRRRSPPDLPCTVFWKMARELTEQNREEPREKIQNIILRKAILTTTIGALLLGATAFRRLHGAEPQPAFRMACIFTDHMVLQRDQPLPVWGWAAPGRPVTVEVGPHSARTRTNAEGRWRLSPCRPSRAAKAH